jgi:hypothetical protein
LVIAVAVADPLKLPLAPVPGAVKVTVTPLTALLLASFTVACSPLVNTLFTAVLWPDPALAVTLAGGAVVLVKLKLAGVVTPVTLAVTV